MDKIIVIGDSHLLWKFDLPEFIRLHLGGRTAYKICDHDDQVREELAKHPDLPTIFSLGEIDCRVFVRPESIAGRSIKNQIDEIIDRYINYLAIVQATKKSKVYAMTIDVAGDIDKLAEGFPMTWGQFDEITLLFNETLKEMCIARGIGIIDVYDEMIDPATGRKREDWRQICESNGMKDWLHCNNNAGIAVLEKYFRG